MFTAWTVPQHGTIVCVLREQYLSTGRWYVYYVNSTCKPDSSSCFLLPTVFGYGTDFFKKCPVVVIESLSYFCHSVHISAVVVSSACLFSEKWKLQSPFSVFARRFQSSFIRRVPFQQPIPESGDSQEIMLTRQTAAGSRSLNRAHKNFLDKSDCCRLQTAALSAEECATVLIFQQQKIGK